MKEDKEVPKKEGELNGFSCPECGEELMDSDPNKILMSYPAKKAVHCSKCKYKGYRFI